MSVSYEIYEHLSIHGSGKAASNVKMAIRKKLSDRLEKIRAMMLAGDAEVYRMPLTGMLPPLRWWIVICTGSIFCPAKRRLPIS